MSFLLSLDTTCNMYSIISARFLLPWLNCCVEMISRLQNKQAKHRMKKRNQTIFSYKK